MTRSRFVPTRRLSVVAGLLAAPLALVVAAGLEPWWAVTAGAFALLVLVALLDAFRAVTPSSLSIERRVPPGITRGDTGSITWLVANTDDRPTTVAIADSLAASLGVDRRLGFRLGARALVDVTRELRPTRRGRIELGPMTVRCAGPLGLAARQQRIPLPGTLRVLPPLRSRALVERRMNARRSALTGVRLTRHQGSGTEFEQLREYEPGDDPRHIDWSATARSNGVVVRSYAVEQNRPVTVLFDTGRIMAGSVAGVPRLEHAMDVTVALGAAVSRSRDRLSLLAYDRVVRAEVVTGVGGGHVAQLTEALFGLHPELVESDHVGALLSAASWLRRRSVLVFVTELHPTVVEESLAPVIAARTARHDVIVVSVRDPRLAEWVAAPVSDRAAMHLAAAAAGALEERDRARRLLEEVGAQVIDDVPGRCAERLVDAYLALRSMPGRRRRAAHPAHR